MYVPVLNILEELELENSQNGKIKIIQKYKNHKDFISVVKYALDPMITFGIKKIPEYSVGSPLMEISRALHLLDKFVDKSCTGNKAIKHLTHILESLEFDDAQVIERVIKKDLMCGCGIKLFNKAFGQELIFEYKVSKCEQYNKKTSENIKFPAIIQIKEDGSRLNAIISKDARNIEYRTGNGKIAHLHGVFDTALKGNFTVGDVVVDGEIIFKDKKGNDLPRKKGNGFLIKAVRGTLTEEESKNAEFRIFDIIPMNNFKKQMKASIDYSFVLKTLQSLNFNNTNVSVVYSEEVNNKSEIDMFFNRMIKQGKEGCIVKNKDHKWEPTRSNTTLKLKAENTMDLYVTEVIEGVGKLEGMLGAFLLESENGEITVRCGTGFSEKERLEYFAKSSVGKLVEVKYNEIIDDKTGRKSLFLPVFSRFREDKL